MGFYERHILPHLINGACGARPIREQRARVVPRARGVVLEIGIGTGLNLPYYDPRVVERLVGLDPSEHSWKLAARRSRELSFPVEFIGLPGERIPLADASVDSIVMTYSLCTIPDPQAALAGMARVLRPDGELLFCEHGLAPDPAVQRWQHRLNPFWRRIAGGCELDRDIPGLLETAGFRLRERASMYLPGTPRFAGFNTWGAAVCCR
jgi:SAM-dependent methyltransferase